MDWELERGWGGGKWGQMEKDIMPHPIFSHFPLLPTSIYPLTTADSSFDFCSAEFFTTSEQTRAGYRIVIRAGLGLSYAFNP